MLPQALEGRLLRLFFFAACMPCDSVWLCSGLKCNPENHDGPYHCLKESCKSYKLIQVICYGCITGNSGICKT